MDKKALRKLIREKKQKFSEVQKQLSSDLIFQQVEQDDRFLQSEVVMIYWGMDDEVQTREFILKWADKKRFILPSVNDDQLELKEFKGLETMVDGEQFAIPEPHGGYFLSPETIELIIIPGVAFDKQNNRMGRGRGYYDKFLSSSEAFKLGVCFDFQMQEAIPCESFDIKMDKVIVG